MNNQKHPAGRKAWIALVFCLSLLFLSPVFIQQAASSSTQYTVTVSSSSSSYSASQQIQVTGSISPPTNNSTNAFIRIINPSGTVVHVDSVAVDGSTGAFSDSFTAGGTNWIDGTYTINATWGASINGPVYFGTRQFTYHVISSSTTVSIAANSTKYFGSEGVGITGTISPTPVSGTNAFVRIINPNGTVVHADSVPVIGSSFTDSFTAGGTNWVAGTYTANATWSSSVSGQVFFGTTQFKYSPSVPGATTVTFSESGLTTGTSWSATLNGVTESSTSATITFANIATGVYAWSVSNPISAGQGTRFVTSSSSGVLNVPLQTSVSITFVKQYQVTFSAVGGTSSPSGTIWENASSTVLIRATPNPTYIFTTWNTSNSAIVIKNPIAPATSATIGGPGSVTANFLKPLVPPVSNKTTVASNGTASTNVNTTVGKIIVHLSNLNSTSGNVNVTVAIVSGNSTGTVNSNATGTIPLSITNVSAVLDIKVNSTSTTGQPLSGTTQICFSSPSVTQDSKIMYWNGSSWAYAESQAFTPPHQVCGSIPLSFLQGTPVIVATPFDFSISVSPNSASVSQGSSTSATASLSLTSGSSQAVTFSTSGLPSGAAASFSPSSCTPACSSTMTITTSSSTPTGSYSITVTGSGGGQTHSATFTLTVTSPPPPPPSTYTVTFTESGLPSGTSWSATLNGQTESSTTTSIAISGITSGTYSWSVSTPVSGASGVRYSASTASGSVDVPSQTSIAVSYVTQYEVSFSSSPSSGGTTTPSGTAWYNAGSQVDILANPQSGYEFSGWSSSTSSISIANPSAASTTATVNGPGAITASFTAVTTSTTSTTSTTASTTSSTTSTSHTTTSTTTTTTSHTTTSTSSTTSTTFTSTTSSTRTTSSTTTTTSTTPHPPTNTLEYALAIAVVAVIVVGSAFFVIRRRRR
ncbi:MAG: hypothetical protein JRN20_06570 [Nitrososphaerota archaeon]|nr:hypothetical protein [Nitrososphaerota archaeon]